MLQFNFTRLINARGINKPTSYLVRQGFSEKFASRIVHNNFQSLSLDSVQRLCEVFGCTPNDMLEWYPPSNMDNPSSHPLASLSRREKVMNLSSTLNSVPLDKLLEIEKLIQAEIKKI